MTKLSVNLNKVALLRNARTIDIPSVREAARIVVAAGAHGVTVHPRPDERHITREDVRSLSGGLPVEFNIEGNPFHGLMEIAREARPQQCTLVPDAPAASTSDHGWSLRAEGARLRPLIAELKSFGCRVSLFVDADAPDIAYARELGADRVELYTEPYARAFREGRAAQSLDVFRRAAQAAQAAGLGVNAGHDLNLANLGLFCTIPGILEVSIGHALLSEAMLGPGLHATVTAYLGVLAAANAMTARTVQPGSRSSM